VNLISGNQALPIGDARPTISAFSSDLREDFTMVRKISLALVLMTMAGMASAKDMDSNKCFQILWFDFCTPSEKHDHDRVQAPEIDPASAMAGLTMLAGGLAVLRGRRRVNLKE
jgi:hypothetical protein